MIQASSYQQFKSYFIKTRPGLYTRLEKRKLIIKFLLSGFTAASTDLSLLYLFTSGLGAHYLVSSALAFVVTFFVSFNLQKFWTFRDSCVDQMYSQMSIYLAVALVNLVLNSLGMYLVVEHFGIMYLFAQIIVGATIGLESFLFYRYVIFNKKKEQTG